MAYTVPPRPLPGRPVRLELLHRLLARERRRIGTTRRKRAHGSPCCLECACLPGSASEAPGWVRAEQPRLSRTSCAASQAGQHMAPQS